MALPEPPIYPDLKGKVVLITGVGQQGDKEMWGNGAATARVFAQQGSKIFGCDLNLESAQYTKRKLESEGGEIEVMTADVTKSDQCKQLIDECMRRHGRIDVLVKYVNAIQLPLSTSNANNPTTSATSACRKQADQRTCRKKSGMLRWM